MPTTGTRKEACAPLTIPDSLNSHIFAGEVITAGPVTDVIEKIAWEFVPDDSRPTGPHISAGAVIFMSAGSCKAAGDVMEKIAGPPIAVDDQSARPHIPAGDGTAMSAGALIPAGHVIEMTVGTIIPAMGVKARELVEAARLADESSLSSETVVLAELHGAACLFECGCAVSLFRMLPRRPRTPRAL